MTASGKVVTILDVALAAKTSPSTVSNLLNGRVNRMHPDTRARIEQAIAQLGYRPSQAARQLRTGRTPVLGLIIPSVANPFWGSFAQRVEETARVRGYQVLLGTGERDPAWEHQYAKALWSQGVRGIIFGSSPPSLSHVLSLVRDGLCVVAFDRAGHLGDPVDRQIIDSVSIDNIAAAHLATNHLLELGHRRIGFLSGPIRTVSRRERREGYHRALLARGIDPEPNLVWEGNEGDGIGDFEGIAFGRAGACALLGREHPPTALVTINDLYALGAYAGVHDLGLRVPADVSIVGFDDTVLAELAQPPLTTIRQPLGEMLTTAVTLLIDRMEGVHTAAAEHVTWPPELIVRHSTAPPAATSRREAPG
jgi:DNA-binding LacI/PurR family transcriptional regulator